MFPFDVILFDVGGVLLTNGWDHRERAAVVDQFQLDRVEFERRHTEANDPWERDAISAGQYLDATVFYEPRSFSKDEFMSAIFAQSKALPNGALGMLSELAASHKYMLGVLNNEAREPNDYRFQTSDYAIKWMWPLVLAIWACASRRRNLSPRFGHSGDAGTAHVVY